MRMIGTLTQKGQARRFSDYLLVNGIPNQVDDESEDGFHLWVLDDRHLAEAERRLADFLRDPDASEYRGQSGSAEAIRSREAKLARKSPVIDVRTHWHRLDTALAPVTATLIALSVLITALSFLDRGGIWIDYFYITTYDIVGPYLEWNGHLPEILHGQVWRLVTPIFIHMSFLHILFNMLWMKDLGTVLERKLGTLYFIALVLVVAVCSNLGQFFLSGPNFGGMSGVVYGLLGYAWIRGRFDPSSGLSLNQSVVTMMIIWFFLCMTGLMGNVANWAHGFGLVTGMIWGFLAAKLRR
ncbi:MAG: rhomboid family intramembrane serine protease [Deltaproteobacteria bacterium]|nr:rhomboid family intramembrane serine protease [Deltaproteobacteria bacterium]